VNTLWRANVPQLYVETDREKAKAMGVPIDEVYNTLAATLGTYYVNDFNKYGRTWQVLMSAEPAYRKSPDDVGAVYVRSDRGQMVPLAALAKVNYSSGPDSLERFNNLPAVKIFGATKPGFSSGQAIERMEKIARATLPSGFSFDWGGASFQEKRSGGTSVLALGLAALMMFLILAAQYDRWSLPLSVMLALKARKLGLSEDELDFDISEQMTEDDWAALDAFEKVLRAVSGLRTAAALPRAARRLQCWAADRTLSIHSGMSRYSPRSPKTGRWFPNSLWARLPRARISRAAIA